MVMVKSALAHPITGQGLLCPGSVRLAEPWSPHPLLCSTTSSALLCSPAFTFPHPINPVAYQQILSQQRGLGSAFGHTPPLIQPSPTFLAQQPVALTSINTTHPQLSSSSNCLNDTSQVGGCRAQGGPTDVLTPRVLVVPVSHWQHAGGLGMQVCLGVPSVKRPHD